MAKKRVDVIERVSRLTEELESHGDRGAALLASAMLENALSATIQMRLLELSSRSREALFGGAAPFSSFGAKIELGFALGLYGNEDYRVIAMIRDVCSRFVNELALQRFDDLKIIEMLRKVASPHLPKNLSPRRLFTTVFVGSINLLYVEQNADIRLVSLHDTQPRLFVQANAASVQLATASTNPISRTVAELSSHECTPATEEATDAVRASLLKRFEVRYQMRDRSINHAPSNLAGE
jgi:hypothetical protein